MTAMGEITSLVNRVLKMQATGSDKDILKQYHANTLIGKLIIDEFKSHGYTVVQIHTIIKAQVYGSTK